MNNFESKSAKVLKSSFRKVNTANGSTGRVILVLDNGETHFYSPKAVNNATDFLLNVNTVKMLQGSMLHYEASDVKIGTEFIWNSSADEVNVADRDLQIRNPIAFVHDTAGQAYLVEHCDSIASQDDWDAIVNAVPDEEEEEEPEGASEDTSEDEPVTEGTTSAKSSAKGKTNVAK